MASDRATCNGIAAATGKFGAFVGAFLFPYFAETSGGYPLVLGLSAGIAFGGALLTYSLVHPKELMNGDADRVFGRWENLLDANTSSSFVSHTPTKPALEVVKTEKLPKNMSFATVQSSPGSVHSTAGGGGGRGRSRSDSSTSSTCMMIPLNSSRSPSRPSSQSPSDDDSENNTTSSPLTAGGFQDPVLTTNKTAEVMNALHTLPSQQQVQ